jgi:hypothetical protein
MIYAIYTAAWLYLLVADCADAIRELRCQA